MGKTYNFSEGQAFVLDLAQNVYDQIDFNLVLILLSKSKMTLLVHEAQIIDSNN